MNKKYDFLIVGAGISGITLAERLASIGGKILLIDKRNHFGGNCYDFKREGILIQRYGPHIFHTNNKKVFEYLKKFTKFNKYQHKVLAYYNKKYFPIPINLNTVNKFFYINLKDKKELKSFLKKKKKKIKKIKNSEEVIISKFGKELYEAFIKNYTKKQWDKYPSELDKSILERLPIRYDKNDKYFDDLSQGMPEKGYTKMFEKMLFNKKIILKLNTSYNKRLKSIAKKIIWTGRIDNYFDEKLGELEYRGIKFFFQWFKLKNFLPNSVVNFPEKKPKYSRITEFKRFYETPSKKTIICKEFFLWGGEPAYPVNTLKNTKLLKKYESLAKKEKDIFFLGRLGKYKYLNMDQCVEEALDLFEELKKRT